MQVNFQKFKMLQMHKFVSNLTNKGFSYRLLTHISPPQKQIKYLYEKIVKVKVKVY